MKKFGLKSLSFIVALTVILSSAFMSVFAVAEAQEKTDYNLTVRTAFYKENDDGEWIYTEKAYPGEKLKARVFIGTDYYAGHAELVFFADNKLLEDTYELSTLVDMPANLDYSFGYTSKLVKADSNNGQIKRLINNGCITQEFADNHYAYLVSVNISNKNPDCQIYDDTKWVAELDFKVSKNLIGDASFLVLTETVRTTDNPYGRIDVPVGDFDSSPSYSTSMSSIEVDFSLVSGVVSTASNITFDAYGGAFADGSAVKTQPALIGSDFNELIGSVEAPVREGHTFVGWDTDMIIVPESDTVIYAAWELNNYTLSFNANGGTFADGSTSAVYEVAYGDNIGLLSVAIPANGESAFLGWQTADGVKVDISAMTMPASDNELYAIWEAPKDVVYTVEVINAPKKLNYRSNLDISGMQLKISGDDGSVNYITDTARMNINGFNSRKIGNQTVSVECDGYYAEFEVNVSYAWWQWIIRILLLGFIWY